MQQKRLQNCGLLIVKTLHCAESRYETSKLQKNFNSTRFLKSFSTNNWSRRTMPANKRNEVVTISQFLVSLVTNESAKIFLSASKMIYAFLNNFRWQFYSSLKFTGNCASEKCIWPLSLLCYTVWWLIRLCHCN